MLSRRGGLGRLLRALRNRPWPRFAVASSVVVALLGTLGYVLVVGSASAVSEWLDNCLTVALAMAMTATSMWAARQARGRTRLAWGLMTAAGASWSTAEVLWLLENYVWHSDRVPAFSDVPYLLALVPAAAALTVFPPPVREASDRVRMLLAGLVVGGSVLFVSRALAFSVILPAATGSWAAQAVFLAYPTADVVLATLALVALLRVQRQARGHLILLTVGFLFYTVADTAYVREAALDSYAAGSLLDWGWAAGYSLFALAPFVPHATADADAAPRSTRAPRFDWSSLALYVPLLLAIVVAAAGPSRLTDPILIVTGVTTLVLFALRQALLSGDSGRLRRDLESQVGQLEERSTQLRRLASENEGVVRSVVDGVFGVDAAGLLTFANPRAAELLHRPATELIGSPQSALFADRRAAGTGDQPAGTEERSDIARALATGTMVSGARARFRAGDGSVVPVELAVGPIREGATIVGAVVVFRDVSARLAVEKMKNEFVSVVSHELRTPLTSIRGSLGMLAGGAGGELSSTGSRMVTIALHSSERLTRLIEDMLDLERMESGALTMVPVVCEIRPLVNTALDEVDAMARQYGVHVSVEPSDGLVHGDADRIVQTLTNVLGNSIKFSPRGGTVTVSTSQQGDLVEFAITDLGRGIPADKLGHIFERFEQVDSSDARQHGGTGLGLAISRDIVNLHGGTIWAESALGQGSTFRFTLPGTLRPGAADGPAEVRRHLDEGAELSGTSGDGAEGRVGAPVVS